VIIKLADRLHNMRTLRWLDPPQRIMNATETMEIYAPLASRLGMARIKSELEDLAMRWLHPEAYEFIAARVARALAHRERIVQQFVDFLRRLLDEAQIPVFEISGRPKHFHSIHTKMQRQGLSFDEVFDLIALRIITDTVADCYDIIGIIHGEWKPIPGRFKDYIAVPKENLYQSLHTTVVGLSGEIVEIQIRTREMHRVSEMGVAAHWKYKEGHGREHELDDQLVWLRQLVDWIQEVRDPGEFLDALQGDVFADTVFCFTPQGDVLELPQGSTVIDFAFHIHSEVGKTCVGARVNKKMVPLRTELNSGDLVEIVTAKNGHPSRDWLEFAKTNRARNKIRHWLRAENHEVNLASGREMLLRAARSRHLSLSLEEMAERLRPHLAAMRLKSFDDACAEIGFGSIQATTVVNRLLEAEPRPITEAPEERPARAPAVTGPSGDGVRVAGVGNTLVKFSRCCEPLPGDDIVGFVTRGRGVTIHKRQCPNLRRITGNPQNANRVVEAVWDSAAQQPRPTEVRVIARDRTGLLADLTQVLTERGIFIDSSSSKSNRDTTATVRFNLLVRSNNQLNAVMERLRRVKGVLDLTRAGNGETDLRAERPAKSRRPRQRRR
jgi:guanosine-3',5'-bis(diphosphate) 3'-pyrophosphohydrolase